MRLDEGCMRKALYTQYMYVCVLVCVCVFVCVWRMLRGNACVKGSDGRERACSCVCV